VQDVRDVRGRTIRVRLVKQERLLETVGANIKMEWNRASSNPRRGSFGRALRGIGSWVLLRKGWLPLNEAQSPKPSWSRRSLARDLGSSVC